ncbi:MAG: hypothetical protein CMH53_10205 [Myxococcales bacterium]|nr:hypothetical protein [Myxococcales bacterium]
METCNFGVRDWRRAHPDESCAGGGRQLRNQSSTSLSETQARLVQQMCPTGEELLQKPQAEEIS